MMLLSRRAPVPLGDEPRVDPPPPTGLPPWSRAVVGALVAAAASAVLFCLPAVLTWLTSAYTVGSGGQAVQLGLAGWLLTHGVPLSVGRATVSMVPWVLTLIPLGTLLWASRWVVAALDQGRPSRLVWAAGLRRDVAVCAAVFVASYGGIAMAVALASGPVGVVANPLAALALPAALAAVAYLVALHREFRDELAEVAPGMTLWWQESVPPLLRRGVRPAGRGMLLIWLVGLAVALAQLVLRRDRVGYLHGELEPGFFGGVLLVVAAIAYLPTVAVWGAAWLSGPGFGIGEAGSVSLTRADPGIIPLVPLFGAIPDQGNLPDWTWLGLLVPVAVGAYLTHRALAHLALAQPGRPASGRAQAATAASAIVLSGVGLGVLALAASGSLGAARLAHVGVHPVWFPLAVTVEMLLGGAALLVIRQVRPRVIETPGQTTQHAAERPAKPTAAAPRAGAGAWVRARVRPVRRAGHAGSADRVPLRRD